MDYGDLFVVSGLGSDRRHSSHHQLLSAISGGPATHYYRVTLGLIANCVLKS
jgi:hypothetical protein